MALRRAPVSSGNTQVAAGFRHLWRQPVVRTLTLFTAAMNIPWAVSTALFVVPPSLPAPSASPRPIRPDPDRDGGRRADRLGRGRTPAAAVRG